MYQDTDITLELSTFFAVYGGVVARKQVHVMTWGVIIKYVSNISSA